MVEPALRMPQQDSTDSDWQANVAVSAASLGPSAAVHRRVNRPILLNVPTVLRPLLRTDAGASRTLLSFSIVQTADSAWLFNGKTSSGFISDAIGIADITSEHVRPARMVTCPAHTSASRNDGCERVCAGGAKDPTARPMRDATYPHAVATTARD